MPDSAFTTSSMSEIAMRPTWLKSFSTSSPGLLYMRMLLDMVLAEYTQVWPSGAARAASCAPSLPEAPPLFSTTTGCLRSSDMASATTRTVVSGDMPAR